MKERLDSIVLLSRKNTSFPKIFSTAIYLCFDDHEQRHLLTWHVCGAAIVRCKEDDQVRATLASSTHELDVMCIAIPPAGCESPPCHVFAFFCYIALFQQHGHTQDTSQKKHTTNY